MPFKANKLDRLSTLVHCLIQISNWLTISYLVLNANKADIVVIAPPELYPKISQALAYVGTYYNGLHIKLAS